MNAARAVSRKQWLYRQTGLTSSSPIWNNGTDLVLIDTPREAGNAGYVAAKAADFVTF